MKLFLSWREEINKHGPGPLRHDARRGFGVPIPGGGLVLGEGTTQAPDGDRLCTAVQGVRSGSPDGVVKVLEGCARPVLGSVVHFAVGSQSAASRIAASISGGLKCRGEEIAPGTGVETLGTAAWFNVKSKIIPLEMIFSSKKALQSMARWCVALPVSAGTRVPCVCWRDTEGFFSTAT